MRLTSGSFCKAYGIPLSVANAWYPHIMDQIHGYHLKNEKEILHLIAQMAYETSLFRRVRENLNYTTPDRLLYVFEKYIDKNEVDKYVKNPRALANRVYANRLGNGDEDSEDGWNYRGGGGLMLTGKTNYRGYTNACGVDLVRDPSLITGMEHATGSAAWFWVHNDLGKFAIKDDVKGLTKAIVGSSESAPKRQKLFNDLMTVALK